MNTNAVSSSVSSVFDAETPHPATHASHAKHVNDTASIEQTTAFASTLAAMLNMAGAPQSVVNAAKNSEGAESDLEQTAGDIAGRAKDTDGEPGKRVVKADGGRGSRLAAGSVLGKNGKVIETAPLIDSNTMSVTIDDNFRAANSASHAKGAHGPAESDTETLSAALNSVAGVAAAVTTDPVAAPAMNATTPKALDVVPMLSMEAKPLAGVESKPTFAKAASAREAASAASATNVAAVNNDTDALNPEFRTRLNRVVNRMRDEYGHDVEVVEGYRPQDRQNYLYEQGRSRPGDVVTWTKSSKHTLGMAADIKIDGTYNNPEAYKHLAQIANQEGLRTLGARDPGHVELPSRAGAAAWGAPAESVRIDESVSRAVELAIAKSSLGSDDESSSTSQNIDNFNSFMSRAARTTGDSVRSMQASQNGGSGLGGGMSHGGSGFGSGAFGRQGFTQGTTAAQSLLAQSTLAHSSSQSDKGTGGAIPVIDPSQVAPVAQVAQIAGVAQVATVAPVANVAAGNATESATATNGTSTADRVGRILDVREATAARPLSHMTLAVDNASGGTDHIRVDMRGSAVHTAISLGDHAGADKMSLRVGELQHALEQQGLESGSIRVATTSADTGAGWSQHHKGDGSAQQQDRQPANYRGNARQDADDLHRDAQRQRARRDHKEGGK